MIPQRQETSALKIGVVGARGIGKLQGGIEHYCSHFYRELCPYGFDVTIFVRRATGSAETPAGVRTFFLPVPQVRSLETILHSSHLLSPHDCSAFVRSMFMASVHAWYFP